MCNEDDPRNQGLSTCPVPERISGTTPRTVASNAPDPFSCAVAADTWENECLSPTMMDTSLNSALQRRFMGLPDDPLPQQTPSQVPNEIANIPAAGSSNSFCFVRPLAAPRMLPSFHNFEPFPTERNELVPRACSSNAPNNSCPSVVSSSSTEEPHDKKGLFWPLSDQEMLDFRMMSEEPAPPSASFHDQICRLLQDRLQQDAESRGSPEAVDGTSKEWQFDPLILQREGPC